MSGHAGLHADHRHVVGDHVVEFSGDTALFLRDGLARAPFLFAVELCRHSGELAVAFGQLSGPVSEQPDHGRYHHRLDHSDQDTEFRGGQAAVEDDRGGQRGTGCGRPRGAVGRQRCTERSPGTRS